MQLEVFVGSSILVAAEKNSKILVYVQWSCLCPLFLRTGYLLCSMCCVPSVFVQSIRPSSAFFVGDDKLEEDMTVGTKK